jgi:hypothetical protein
VFRAFEWEVEKMGFELSNRRRNRSSRRVFASFLATVALACLGASPAKARGEFADGFEDQLGRIVAFQVARVGGLILTGGHHHHPHVRAAYRHTPWRRHHYRPFRPRVRHPIVPRQRYRPETCDYGRVVYERIERHERGDTFTVSRMIRCDGRR